MVTPVKAMEGGSSVTRLGEFWKHKATNFLSKVAQKFSNFEGYFDKQYFLSKTAEITFGQLLVNFWHFLYQHLVTLGGSAFNQVNSWLFFWKNPFTDA